MYNGLACPPMDDYAFNDFYGDDQAASINLDPNLFFADPIEEEIHPQKKKLSVSRSNRKGKEWKRVLQVLKPNMEMVAKVNAKLEPMRCRLSVEGVTIHKTTSAPPVTKTPKIKIVVNRQANVVMQSVQKKRLIETRRPEILMPMNENDFFERKLEATKRKLRDSYDQAGNFKKQRKIQLIDLQNLPPMPTTNKKSKANPKVGRTTTWNRFG